MVKDYRKLCLEVFGTDDEAELRAIAKTVKKNPRNAGRKRKFTPADITEMERLRNDGMAINDIAERFGTSRQMIGKYLTEVPVAGCTMRMIYMFRQHPCTVIDVDFLHRKLYVQNKTNDVLHRAFGVIEEPTWDDFEYFLRDRCFPETRGNRKELLRELELTDYDPLQIIEKTQGRMADDDMWVRIRTFQGGAGSENH